MSAPTIGALFAGYGGLDRAVHEVLGASPAWVSEIEPGPSRILAQRYPGVPNLGDVTAVDWAAVEPVDIITGGFPCQDVSHAGRRAGLRDGTRTGLWSRMAEAIDTLRPGLVVAENVRGLLSAAADSDVEPCPWCLGEAGDGEPAVRALGAVLADLADIGYSAAWCGLRAADVGAPHGRFRVFVLAWPAADTGHGLHGQHGGGVAGATTGGQRWDAGAGRGSANRDRGTVTWGSREWRDLTLLPSPRTSDTNGAGAHGAGGLDLRTAVSLLPTPKTTDSKGHSPGDLRRAEPGLRSLPSLLPTPRATDGTKGGPNQRGSSGDLMLPSAVTLLPTPAVNDMGAGKTVEDWDARTARMKAAHGNGNGHGKSLAIEALRGFGAYAPAIARWEAVLGRPAPAPTEPTGKGGAHRLSPAFVEFMMGLPDGWVTDVGLTRNEQLKALGNGVVPQQAATAIRHLLTVRAAALAGQEVAS